MDAIITDEVKDMFVSLFPSDTIKNVKVTDNSTLLEITATERVNLKAHKQTNGYFINVYQNIDKTWFYSIWSIYYPPKYGIAF